MQHLGSELELVRVMKEIWATMTPEEREEIYPIQERLKGLSLEDLLRELSPQEREQLRLLLQQPEKSDSSTPKGS